MAKRFDCEDEPNDFMDMPCRCDCGKWFDLNDGYNGKDNKVVCRECAEDLKKMHLGDEVSFKEALYINGRLRAYEYDKGTIINKHGEIEGKTSVKIEGRKYPVHHVPVNILEKL